MIEVHERQDKKRCQHLHKMRSKILRVFLVALITAVTLNIIAAPKAASQDLVPLIASYTVTVTSPQVAGVGWTDVEAVTAYDEYGNVVTSDNSTIVTLTNTGSTKFYTDGTYTIETSTYQLTSGKATIYVKDTKAETITITATDANGKTGTSADVVINPAAIDQYAVSWESCRRRVYKPLNFTIQAQDEYGNDITTGPEASENITITFGKPDPEATPTSTTTANGTATVTITMTAGQIGQTIIFTGDTSGKSGAFFLGNVSSYFYETKADPPEITRGQEQILSTRSKDSLGISWMKAHIEYFEGYENGNNRFVMGVRFPPKNEWVEMRLVEGTNREGRWEGSWIGKGEISWYSWYKIGFCLRNGANVTSSASIEASGLVPDFPLEYESEPAHEIPAGFPSERASVWGVSSSGQPSFSGELIIDPGSVESGEIQTFSVTVTDPNGVDNVTATIWAGECGHKRVQIQMQPVEGHWVGTWQARYLYRPCNVVEFKAVSTVGESSTVTMFLSATPEIPPISSYTVTVSSPQPAGVGWTDDKAVVAYDAYGNVITTDSSTVITVTNTGSAKFYTDNTYATETSTYQLTSGKATIYAKDTKAETITITATDGNGKTGTSAPVLIEGTIHGDVDELTLNPLADTAWPMFRHDPQHTGRSPYAGPEVPVLEWSYTVGDHEIFSSPAIGTDGSIYIGSTDGNIYAINPDGTSKWTYVIGGIINSSPAIVTDGTIYVGRDNLYAINPDGSLKWSYATGGYIDSSPAIVTDGTIYIGSSDSNLYAIGPLQWTYAAGANIRSSPAIGTDGTIYIGSSDSNLYAINPDGSLKWNYAAGADFYSSPAIGADGTIYVGSCDKNLYAINPDGSLKWNYNTGDNIRSSPTIGSDGTIYVACFGGKLYAIGDSVIPGDANGDGNVNAIDITKVERIIAGLDATTSGADANQDGNVNAIDITKVERIIAGLD